LVARRMSNKAAVLTAAHSQLQVQNVEKWAPQKGEVLIRNHAIATNPVDWKIQKYGIFVTKFPSILASDVAGVVEVVGEGVTRYKVGDKVWTWLPYLVTFSPRNGGFQEYSIALEAGTGQVPSNFSYEEAAGLALPAATAISGMYILDQLPRPTSTTRPAPDANAPIFYVSGGGSAVGAAAIQLGALAGLRVFATASPKNFDLVKKYGASEVFDYKDEHLVHKVKQAAGGKNIKWVYDAVSEPSTLKCSVEILGGQGSLIMVLPPPADLKTEGLKVSNVFAGVIYKPENAEVLKWYTEFLPKAAAAGTFVPNKPEIVGKSIDDAQKVMDYHASGQVSATKPTIKLA